MAKDVFNPVKEEVDGVKARRAIWTTRSLELATEGLRAGKRLIANPFYDGNVNLLKGDLIFQRTEEEIAEWKKCRKDIIYFVEKYCKLMTPQGIQHVTLRPYQVRYLKHVQDNQLSIGLTPRQAGKTTTTALAMLHYLLFNVDKYSLICSNKRKSAVEVVDKAKKIYEQVPYFLKPGIYKWNEAEIVMDNGCRIQAEATTKNSGIGNTIHFLILDEFAHIAPNIIDKFYNNIFPTVTAAKAKCAIISTQNGRNLFYRLYKAAQQGDNDYKAFEITWQDVPEWNPDTEQWEQRDEAWHRRMVANYGSEEAFNTQFGTSFDIGANTLITQKFIQSIDLRKFEVKDLPGVPFHEAWYWHPDFDPMDLKRNHIVITIDLAEGGGGDYTIISIYRMVGTGVDQLELIGYFRSNTHGREPVVRSFLSLVIKWTNPTSTLISFELNTYGEIFLKQINELNDKEPEYALFDPSTLVKYYTESGTKFHYGIKITSGNKTAHCVLFKESFENHRTVACAEQFIYEVQNFCDDGTGHYKASFGHDDLIMTAVQLEFVRKTLQYRNMRDEYEMGNMQQEDTIWNPYDLDQYTEETAWDRQSKLK